MIFLTQHSAEYTVGGKAKNLFQLRALGLNVPKFIVIPAESTPKYELINEFQIEPNFIQEIINLFPETTYFSVRSSAVDEDGMDHSFAGQFETYLFVSKANLPEKVKSVWKSANSERVRTYREQNGLQTHQKIAVIIQEMIDADVSGVGFGFNPVSGNRTQKIINSVYGLGEGLVSGELNADQFCITNAAIESKIVAKTHAFKFKPGGGTEIRELLSDQQREASLNETQLITISSILSNLFTHFGTYQDIEFAIKDDTIYLLQTRPITTVSSLPDVSSEYIIWDNSNIIESYPGISSPFTFSFINPVYEAVYRQFAALMGVKQKDIDKNGFIFENMLGYLHGRVYYNLLSWYKALALLPGYSLNAEFMERMMGVKQRFELKDSQKHSRFREYLRIVRMGSILLKNMIQLPRMKRSFVSDFNRTMETYNSIAFDELASFEIMLLFSEFEQTLLKKWKAPLVNDFFAMIYFGVLQKLVVKYNLPDSGTVHNDLIASSNDIISTQPIIRSLELAELIQNDADLKSLFLEHSSSEIWNELNTMENMVSRKIEEYILLFGNRCVGELKLETITYREDPLAFITVLKSYVKQGATSKSFNSNDQNLRKIAEEKSKEALRGKVFKRLIFNFFLKRARKTVSDRENLRFERTRAFGMIRTMTNAIGLKFQAENAIENSRDIYYLTKNEIFDYIKGTSIHRDLKALIHLRKTEKLQFEEEQLAERIETFGIVNSGNSFQHKHEQAITDGDISGIPCCAGIVRARVQIIHHPSEIESLNGDILVTSSTDPGWVLLFPTASGILVERGSLLSHSAIVSREMGKPCIVGISNLLNQLNTGDVVEMDGSTGKVRILNEANE